ncbi:MAG: translocation/assembly module TamB domain-containing protein [Polyangiaceae bacterium]|nr:translocation/assembly module TamB domain-containing protein [Polyangiaceae bacterium]
MLFLSALSVAFLWHLNTPAGRRVLTDSLNSALGTALSGKMRIGEVESISPRGLRVRSFSVDDASARRVLEITGLHVEAPLLRIAWALAMSRDLRELTLPHLRANRAEVWLYSGATKEVSLLDALSTRSGVGSSKNSPAPRTPSSLRISLPVIEIGQQIIHGAVLGSPPFDATLSNLHAAVDTSAVSTAIDVSRFSLALKGVLPAEVRSIAAFHFRSPNVFWGAVDGWVGQVQLNGSFRVKGKQVQLTADLPDVDPEAVRKLWPEWPLRREISAHVEAKGALPDLDLQVSVVGPTSEVKLTGEVSTTRPFGAEVNLHAQGLDLSDFSDSAPATSLNLDAHLKARLDGRTPSVQYKASSEATLIAEAKIPALQVNGEIDPTGIRGHALILEPGAPLTADFSLSSAGDLEVDARSAPFIIESVPRLRSFVEATGVAQATLRGSVRKGRVQANLSGSVQRFRLGSVEVGNGQLRGQLRGDLSRPQGLVADLSLDGKDLRGPGFRFGTFSAKARGNQAQSELRALLSDRFGPSVEAEGNLSLGSALRIFGVKLSVRRDGAEILGKLREFRLSSEGLTLGDLELSGHGGSLAASAEVSSKNVRVHALGERVDLDAVTRILGLPRGWVAGTLSIDTDLDANSEYQKGIFHVALGNATLGPVRNVSLRADGTLAGPALSFQFASLVPSVGAVGFSTDATLAGPVLSREAWANAIGKGELQLDRFHLSWLNPALFPLDVEPLAGYVSARVSLERMSDEVLPNALFVVETRDLGLTLPQTDAPPLRITNLDLSLGGTLNGRTGNINMTSVLKDARGALLSGVLSADLDLAAFQRAPLEALASWANIPLQAEVALEERNIDSLPAPISMPELKGKLKARLGISGRLKDPSYQAAVDITGLVSKDTRFGLPVDLGAHASYQTSDQSFSADAQLFEASRRVAQLAVNGHAPPGALSGRTSGAIHLEGSGNLSRLPLAVFSPLADADIVGELTGPVAFGFDAGKPTLKANITLKNAAIARMPVAEGKAEFTLSAKHLSTTLHVKDSTGSLSATAIVPLTFVGAVPRASVEQPIAVRVQAKDFSAGILLPVMSDVFTELGGKITANLDGTLQATDADLTGGFSGEVKLTDGQLQLSAMGMRLNDVHLTSQVRRKDNQTDIFISSLSAKARSDIPNIEGRSIHLHLDGLKLESGEASVALTHPVPILIEGVSQATATGNAKLRLKREPDRFFVDISIPWLTAQLPKASSRRVIDVAENPDIIVAQPLSEEKLSHVRGHGVPWVLHFDLGDAVRVSRSDLSIPLRGSPEIRLGGKTEVVGAIELSPGGRVQLMGKAFSVERGLVQFDTGDSTNPRIDITASWRAPDGTVVYVDIRGTFKQGTLSLRSDPPMLEVELQALLLGGSSAQGETSAESTGIGIGAGLLGDLLADTPLGHLELRTASEDTEVAGKYSTYTAAYRLSDEVWFEGSYKRADDPQEHGDAFSGTVDWRFRKDWSLRTEVGRLGTKMDVLWRYRY